MDVLVCGAQVPFGRGGAEMAQENLVAELRRAGHRAELVRLPVAWEKDRLFDAPTAWRLLPLDADLVITTNFPSYFARHPNKVVWLFHQHRGAFDAADEPWSDVGLDDASLELQRQLAEWDARAIGEAKRVFTLSRVVSDRLLRSTGVDSTPLHHPPPLAERLTPAPSAGHVVLPSRLEANKRPGVLVEAMAHVRSGARAVLAGEGSLRGELERRVAELGIQDRVRFAGFVDDDELVRLVRTAAAVVYPPKDEDYGYVTLQAFLAAKPVVTTADSGGVLEFVEDGVSWLVTDGSPVGVAAAIDRLVADPALAARLGEEGRRRAGSLGWGPVIEALLG
jgi:glycosyltransferase involved in cell wall biosynthesis